MDFTMNSNNDLTLKVTRYVMMSFERIFYSHARGPPEIGVVCIGELNGK